MKKSHPSHLDRFRKEAQRSGFVTIGKAAALGISRKLLSNWAKAGKIQRVACGLYQLSSEVPDEMELLARRSHKLAFSHESALYLNGLAERCSVAHSVTIPSSATLPRFGGAPLKASIFQENFANYGSIDHALNNHYSARYRITALWKDSCQSVAYTSVPLQQTPSGNGYYCSPESLPAGN